MARAQQDWADVLERLLEGDRLALLQLSRLVNGFLGRWNAYDLRDDWDDVVQEVVLAAATALAEGRIRERDAMAGFLRTTARFKFVDRLKRHLRCPEGEALAWEAVVGSSAEPAAELPDPPLRRDLEGALAALSPRQRAAVVAIHVEGRTYPEAAETTGIPLGSLKRHLRDGLQALRSALGPKPLDPKRGKG